MEVIDAGFKGEVYCDEDQRSWKVLRHCAIWKSASVKTMESANFCEHVVTQAALQKSLLLFLSSEVVSVVSDIAHALCMPKKRRPLSIPLERTPSPEYHRAYHGAPFRCLASSRLMLPGKTRRWTRVPDETSEAGESGDYFLFSS